MISNFNDKLSLLSNKVQNTPAREAILNLEATNKTWIRNSGIVLIAL